MKKRFIIAVDFELDGRKKRDIIGYMHQLGMIARTALQAEEIRRVETFNGDVHKIVGPKIRVQA